MTTAALVVGYGNALRSDDGVGPAVADRLARDEEAGTDPRLAGATLVRCHQLTPELALDVARAALVVLVDAARGPAAGSFTLRRLEDAPGLSSSAFSHRVEPATLAGLARALYGTAPPVVLVSVGITSLEPGEGLSPAVAAAVPAVAESVAALVGAWATIGAGDAPAALARVVDRGGTAEHVHA